jgi:hypothetical protein
LIVNAERLEEYGLLGCNVMQFRKPNILVEHVTFVFEHKDRSNMFLKYHALPELHSVTTQNIY